MQLIDNAVLDRLAAEAKASPRLRMNLNLHESLQAKAQRLLVALEPGTQLPIHRHPAVAETQMLLRGRLDVLLYEADGTLRERIPLDPAQGRYGIHIAKGQWHTLDVSEPAVILEVKDGPYQPAAPEDILTL